MTYEITANDDWAREVAHIRRDVAGIIEYYAEVVGFSQDANNLEAPTSLVLAGIPVFPHGDTAPQPGIPALAQLEEAPEAAILLWHYPDSDTTIAAILQDRIRGGAFMGLIITDRLVSIINEHSAAPPDTASLAYLRHIISDSLWATTYEEQTPSPELTQWADMVVKEFTEIAA